MVTLAKLSHIILGSKLKEKVWQDIKLNSKNHPLKLIKYAVYVWEIGRTVPIFSLKSKVFLMRVFCVHPKALINASFKLTKP